MLKRKIFYKNGVLIEDDCLNAMKTLKNNSVDLILCDLPYGTTNNAWDSIIDFEILWSEYKRILKSNGAVVLFCQGVFTAKVILSNAEWFKYKIVWVKSKSTNFLNSRKQPLRQHEDICVFYKNQPIYNPVTEYGKPYFNKRGKNVTTNYGVCKEGYNINPTGARFPTDTIYCEGQESEIIPYRCHPTQKPINLGRYLIRTFTNQDAVVLDNACGSGSFLCSAILENRKFIGIEKNTSSERYIGVPSDYIDLCDKRIKQHIKLLSEGFIFPDISSTLKNAIRPKLIKDAENEYSHA